MRECLYSVNASVQTANTDVFAMWQWPVVYDYVQISVGYLGRHFFATALNWVHSYLNSGLFVCYNVCVLSLVNLLCGVPQGWVLGPLFFSLYILWVIRQDMLHHCHADHISINFLANPKKLITYTSSMVA